MKNISKHISEPVVGSCLVMQKGSAKALMTGAVAGAAGSAARAATDTVANNRASGASPLQGGPAALGVLAITDDEVVLLSGRRGMIRAKATGVAGRLPRRGLVDAELGRARLQAPLRLTWDDGSSWELAVPRKFVKQARGIVEQLAV